jgi:hypothetical protein
MPEMRSTPTENGPYRVWTEEEVASWQGRSCQKEGMMK